MRYRPPRNKWGADFAEDYEKNLEDIERDITGVEEIVEGSKTNAEQALTFATEAKVQAESVQEQFNQVVIEGDSSVEAAQARVDAKNVAHPTLKARLDKDYNEVTAQLADNEKKVDLNIKHPNLVDKLEKLIQYRGMYARVASDNSLRIGIGMNDDIKSVVEYRFLHNADGLLLLRGVLAGVEDGNANRVNVVLNGTFNTNTSGQAYTTTVGDKFTFEFTGNSLFFKRWCESRGGLWKFTLSNGLTRNMSCYATTGAYKDDIVFDNLPYGAYKGVAEFLGDDSLNPPSSSPSRGYIYYGVSSSTVLPMRTGKVLPINETTAKYIVSSKSVPDYAIQGRKANTTSDFAWSPVHGTVTGVSSNISVKIKIDGKVEVNTISALPTFSYKEIKSFELFHRFDVYNPNAVSDGILWKHYLNHIISERNPYLSIQNSMTLQQDVNFGLGYFGMLPSSQSVMSKLLLNNGLEYPSLPTVAKEDYYDYDITSAAFVGENATGSYHACAMDISSITDAYNINKEYEPNNKARMSFRTDDITKVYFTAFQSGTAPSGTKMSCQNRLCCITGVQFPNESLGI